MSASSKSTVQSQKPGTRASMGAPKKKFGKNLNKLVAASAPPIASESAASSKKNHGLLLLSTNKHKEQRTGTAGAGGDSSTATTPRGGGLLSSTPSTTTPNTTDAALPSPKPKSKSIYEKHPSTHDVLKSIVGAAALEEQAAPDAWGVAAAATAGSTEQPGVDAPQEISAAEAATTLETPPPRSSSYADEPPERYAPEEMHERSLTDRFGPRVALDTSWDEYGGRGIPSMTTSTDPQVELMSKAKERAIARKKQEEDAFAQQATRAKERLRELEASSSHSAAAANVPEQPSWDRTRSGSRGLWEPQESKPTSLDTTNMPGPSTTTTSPMLYPGSNTTYSGPVIQLSSYEDRDRGERTSSASAPRMLYDPKSGSMVAVKQQQQGESRKERGKGKRQARDGGTTSTSEKTVMQRKNATSKARKDETTVKAADASTAPAKKKSLNPDRRLPRTCGVLYRRDEKGNLCCADDCEGDLGYGAHSVPGGRTQNPEAYAKFVKEHQHDFSETSNKNGDAYDLAYGSSHHNANGNYNLYDDGGVDVALNTGFNPEQPPEPLEWVKPTDKIELVTGADESPTLKPTAKEWAPSQAALAAAAAVKVEATTTSNASLNASTDQSDNDLDDMDDDDDPIQGLGFDPTQDMDFVMQSPTERAPKPNRLGSINLSALALDTPLYSDEPPNPRHIFAFGTSGTWGANHQATPAADSNSDWNVPVVGNAGGLFGADAFRGGGGGDEPVDSASFLNTITSSSSWGAVPSNNNTNNLSSTSTPNLEGLLTPPGNGTEKTTNNG